MTNNQFVDVSTLNDSMLAMLLNQNAFVGTSNTKFEDFSRNTPMNQGDTVKIKLPSRFNTSAGLEASFQGIERRFVNLTVNEAFTSDFAVSQEEYLFNERKWIEDDGYNACVELGAVVEKNIATVCESEPYRFFGDGVSQINTYGEIAQALAEFWAYGAAPTKTKFYLDVIQQSQIVNSGLNQFVIDRNNREAMSWEVGNWNRCDFFTSNLLPTHISGTEGQQSSTLTVVSVTQNAEGGVTSITFSGTNAADDLDSIKENDSFSFDDGVGAFTNVRYLTFVGRSQTSLKAQFKATADAGSTAGSEVTVNIFPALQAAAGKNQNINTAIVPGMQVSVLPNHKCALITSGNPLYLAMPPLPKDVGFPSANKTDPSTGVSIKTSFGTLFGQNKTGIINSVLFGKKLVPEYSMKIALPE